MVDAVNLSATGFGGASTVNGNNSQNQRNDDVERINGSRNRDFSFIREREDDGADRGQRRTDRVEISSQAQQAQVAAREFISRGRNFTQEQAQEFEEARDVFPRAFERAFEGSRAPEVLARIFGGNDATSEPGDTGDTEDTPNTGDTTGGTETGDTTTDGTDAGDTTGDTTGNTDTGGTTGDTTTDDGIGTGGDTTNDDVVTIPPPDEGTIGTTDPVTTTEETETFASTSTTSSTSGNQGSSFIRFVEI